MADSHIKEFRTQELKLLRLGLVRPFKQAHCVRLLYIIYIIYLDLLRLKFRNKIVQFVSFAELFYFAKTKLAEIDTIPVFF